jgi:hypothetical protein
MSRDERVMALELRVRQDSIKRMIERAKPMNRFLDAVYKLRQIMIHVVIIAFIVTIGAFAIWF